MSVGYLFLLLALLSAAGLGISHKLADLRGCKPRAISVALFLSASMIIWSYVLATRALGPGQILSFSGMRVGVVALFCGACAGLGILTFQVGVRYGPITTSWLVVNLSTLVPSILAFVVYREWRNPIKWQQPVALLLVIASVVLLWRQRAVEQRRRQSAEQSPASNPGERVLSQKHTV